MSVSQSMDSSHWVWIKRCLVVVLVALSIQMVFMTNLWRTGGQDRLMYSQNEWQRQASMLSEKLTSSGLSGSQASFYTSVIQKYTPMRAAADAPWSSITFSIYLDLPMEYTCDNIKDESHRLQSCRKVAQLVDYMVSKQEDTKSPDLYLVPMDYLALRATKSTNKSQAVTTVLDTMTRGMRYLHFGGSDHVFLCLTEGCGKIMHEVLVRHPLGKDTRAMWVGAEQYLQDFRRQWPCPDRVLNAPKPLLKFIQSSTLRLEPSEPTVDTLNQGARALLEAAVRKVEGRNRWACSKAKWDLDPNPSKWAGFQGCMPVTRHNLCVNVMAKCGSTSMKTLLQRMSGIPFWNDTSRNPHRGDSGLYRTSPKGRKNYIGNLTDTGVIKIAIIRDPEERFLSAYLNKMVDKRNTILGFNEKGASIPSLDEVINLLMEFSKNGTLDGVDRHFRPQSNWGSMRYVRYDFVGTLPSLGDDVETFLTSLGLWEMYGASGWGENGALSFTEFKGRNRKPKSIHPVQPTPEQRKKIHEIYAEDYHRFPFFMENQ